MTVTVLDVAGQYPELGEAMSHPAPPLGPEDYGAVLLNAQPPSIGLVLAGGALCNDASLGVDIQTGSTHTVGDPTEGALLVVASQAGLRKRDLQQLLPRVSELPFDSDRKRMTTVHSLPAASEQLPSILQALDTAPTSYVAFTKGTVDGLLEISSQVWVDHHSEPLTGSWRERIQAANDPRPGL